MDTSNMSSREIAIALSIPAVLGTSSQLTGIIIGFNLWREKADFLLFSEMYYVHAVLSVLSCFVGTVLCLLTICFSSKTSILFGVVIFPSYLLSVALLSPWAEVVGTSSVLVSEFLTFDCFIIVGSAIILTLGIIYLVLTLKEVNVMQKKIHAAEKFRYQPHIIATQQFNARLSP